MDGQNYLVFHNDSDDSYANTSANFRGADVGTEFIDLYFSSATYAGTGAGYDKIRLEVLAGKEEVALEGVMAGFAGSKAGAITVIADDKNSSYVHENVEAVTSITLASQVQTRVYEDIQGTKALDAADSGKILGLDLLAGFTMTLPAIADAGAGWYCDIVVKTVTTSNQYIITEKTSADTNKICAIGLEAATTGAQISNAGFTTMTFDATPTKGDKISIYCDGTFYYATVITAADGDMVFA